MNEYMPFITVFMNNFLPPVLTALAILLAGYAVQGIRLLQEQIKSTQPDLYEQMQWFAELAVKAAEQAGMAGIIADKKEYALEAVEALLAEYGFKDVDVRVIDAAVEAAVLEVFNTEWDVIEDYDDDDVDLVD